MREAQDHDDSGLDDAVWDALQGSSDEVCRGVMPVSWRPGAVVRGCHLLLPNGTQLSHKLHQPILQEPERPHSKRSRHSLDDGGHGGAAAPAPASVIELPSELLLRVLSFLSAEDLTASAASTCRAFRAAADDAASWRRLFTMRWGGAQGSSSTEGLSWKVCAVVTRLWRCPAHSAAVNGAAPAECAAGHTTHALNCALQSCYMERDRLELEEIRRRIPPPMQPFYLQACYKQNRLLSHATLTNMRGAECTL